MTPGRRRNLARYVIAGVLVLGGGALIASLSSPRGPDAGAATVLAVAASACCLILGMLWAARRQNEMVGVLGAVALAVGSLSQSYALLGLAGCFLIAVLNSFCALLYSMRGVVAVIVIATAATGVLGIQLAHRTGDPVLAIGAVAVVSALNVGLPLAVVAIAQTVRMDLNEADRDALTGLYHRRAFLREGADLTRSATDPDARLVVMMIDIDDFKRLNDNAGHAAGDRALIAIAKTLRDVAAMSAVIARWGGEEFALADLLGDDEAGELAEHLCRRLAAIPSPVPFTASIGWSGTGLRTIGLGGEAEAIDALLVRADGAMYVAKRNGGNQVQRFQVEPLGVADDTARRLDAAVDGVGLTSVFQPIVSLSDETVIGYEVLTRWPELDDPHPTDVFARAENTGRTDELEGRCTASALRNALDAGVGRDSWLFINTEPSVSAIAAIDGQRLVVELTERRLLERPGALLRKVDALRAQGYTIALDDVGAQPDSLALLDIVCPEVIKLEPGVIQQGADNEAVRTLAAVLAHRRRTGATILVEGIETTAQLERARAIGAALGQGFRFGRPAPLDRVCAVTRWAPEPMDHLPPAGPGTPFDIVADRAEVRRERRDTLVALSRYIESLALATANPPIVLAALQHVDHFTARTRQAYRRISAASPLVAVFGDGLPADLGSLRSVPLDPQDPLTAEWVVLILGPDTATALIAREQHSRRDDGERVFAAALTNDRLLVTRAARCLLSRVG